MFPFPNKFISMCCLSLYRGPTLALVDTLSHHTHLTSHAHYITSTPCSLSTMVAPRGGAAQRARPPLAPATTRHSKKTTVPATVTKTPARGGICSSPWHTQSTNAAASTLTNLAEQARTPPRHHILSAPHCSTTTTTHNTTNRRHFFPQRHQLPRC